MMRTADVALCIEDEASAAERMPTGSAKSGFGPRETSSDVVEHVLTFVLTLHILKCKTLILQGGGEGGN
jgi:hypothetical protein